MLARLAATFKQLAALVERRDVYTILIIFFVGAASYGLGKLSEVRTERPAVQVIEAVAGEGSAVAALEATAPEAPETPPAVPGSFVGSRNSDKYHYPWCPGAQRIKEENKVWFTTREEAERAGYTPASNCKGL